MLRSLSCLPSRVRCLSTQAPLAALDKSSVEFWNSNSETYSQNVFAFFCSQFADQIVSRYSGPSSSFLDLGAGTGAVSSQLASRYPDSAITAVDFSEGMLEALKANAVPNVTPVVGDGQALPEEWTNRFDAAFANLSVIFMPDRVACFKELARVVKPGGVAIVTGWAPLQDNTAVSTVWGAMEAAMQESFKRDPDHPAAATHVPFAEREEAVLSLSGSLQFKEEMREGGLEDVRVAKMWSNYTGDADTFLRMSLATLGPKVAKSFEDDFTAALLGEANARIAGVAGKGRLAASINVGIGVAPSS